MTRSTDASATPPAMNPLSWRFSRTAPECVSPTPDEQVRHQPDARLGQVAGRLAEVGRPDPDVRVADQDHVVLAVPLHRRQVLDLRIEPEGRAADDELGVVVGKLGEQLLHDRDGRVVGVGDAEEQLVDGIIELEEAAQVLLEPFVQPLERLEDRDRRRVIGAASCRGLAA